MSHFRPNSSLPAGRDSGSSGGRGYQGTGNFNSDKIWGKNRFGKREGAEAAFDLGEEAKKGPFSGKRACLGQRNIEGYKRW